MKRNKFTCWFLSGILAVSSCLTAYSSETILAPWSLVSEEGALESISTGDPLSAENSFSTHEDLTGRGTSAMEETIAIEETEERVTEELPVGSDPEEVFRIPEFTLTETDLYGEDSLTIRESSAEQSFPDSDRDGELRIEELSEEELLSAISLEDDEDLFSQDARTLPDFEARTEAGEEFLKEIRSGNMILLASSLEDESASTVAKAGESMVALASSNTGYTIVQKGAIDLGDSEAYWANTGYRFIQYTDSNGVNREAPLYCLNASRTATGVLGQLTADNKWQGSAPLSQIDVLNNVNLQKILYFGYMGPGDKTLEYDPTCSHIDWKNSKNRYAFTHYALSYVYSGDLGGVTVEHAKESGLMRYIDFLEKQTLPSFNDLTFRCTTSYTDAEVATSTSGRNLTTKFALNHNSTQDIIDKTGYKDGYQITSTISIDGNAQNYITLTTASDGSRWRLLYWKSYEDWKNLGTRGAIVADPGSAVKLYGGYRFRIVAHAGRLTTWKLNFTMGLRPTRFVLVKGNMNINYPEYKDLQQQDFGAYVYSEEPAAMSLTITPAPFGNLTVVKNSSYTGSSVAGAKFGLYAAAKIYSGYILLHSPDQKVEEFTMTSGTYQIGHLPPGKYYLKELEAPEGYSLNSTRYPVTLNQSDCVKEDGTYNKVSVVAVNDPVIKVRVTLVKTDADSGEKLEGASFVIDEWNGTQYAASTKYLVTYRADSGRYESNDLVWTKTNQGKFRIREVEPPKGYEGGYSKTFVIGEQFPKHQEVLDLGTAPNKKTLQKTIRIYKTDAQTGEVLKDAEFTLSEWTPSGYQKRELLQWREDTQVYESSPLAVTEANQGRFRVEETKNPEGYEGTWSGEFQLNDEKDTLSRRVTNQRIENPSAVVRVVKKDSRTGALLEGAVFEILTWNDGRSEYVSSEKKLLLVYDAENGYYESELLYRTEENLGRFKVLETKNPDGYSGSFEKEFEITEKGSGEFLFTAYNDPPKALGQIVVTKRIRESDINWANGNPTFFFIVEGTDTDGTVHRYEDYVVFVKGTGSYDVDTDGYASTSVVFRDLPEGSYRVTERQTARYYLAGLQANTPNVSVWSSGSAGYGMNPASSFAGTAELGTKGWESTLSAAMTFTNEKKRWDQYSHTDVLKNVIPETW